MTLLRTRVLELACISLIVTTLGTGCSTLVPRAKKPVAKTELEKLNPVELDETTLRTKADYHFTLGEALSLEGQHQKAIEEFKHTLTYDHESASVITRLAKEYAKAGLYTEALETVERAILADSNAADAHLTAGQLYASMRMYDLAVKSFKEVLRVNPDDIETPIFLGAILAELEKFDEAEMYFYSLANNPDFLEPQMAYYYMGRLRQEQGNPQSLNKAIEHYSKALAVKPKYPEAVMALAEVYETQTKHNFSLSLLSSYQTQFGPDRKIAVRLSQKFLEANQYTKAIEQLRLMEDFEPQNLDIKLRLGLVYIQTKDLEKASAKLEEILDDAPLHDRVRFYLGAVYEEMNDSKKAIYHYAKVPVESPFFVESVIQGSQLLRESGDAKRSTETVARAIQLREDSPQLYAFYATILDQEKQYQKAVKVLEESSKKFPESTQLKFFLGSIYDKVGKREKTIELMKQVLASDANHHQALNYLAYTYADMGVNLDEAEALAYRALEHQPKDSYILDTIGWVHFKKGNTSKSIKYLESAHQLNPNESIIAEHLGDAYYKNEMVMKAKQMYERAFKVEADEKKQSEILSKIATIERTNIRVPTQVVDKKPSQANVEAGSRMPASVDTPKDVTEPAQ